VEGRRLTIQGSWAARGAFVSSLENWRRRLSGRKRQPLPPEKEGFADGEVKITCDLEPIKNQTAKLLYSF
jgi:hypothetical protein